MARLSSLFVLTLALLATASAQAAPSAPAAGTAPAPKAATLVPDAPSLPSKSDILIDYHSGQVLAEKNADERVEPASLTKIMTAYVVFRELKAGNIHLDDKVHISEKAWRMKGSRMFVEVNTDVPAGELVKGMIIQSGNDASVALAEHTAGSEDAFVTLMNQQAQRLGMTHTHFANATGMPNPEHYTTARDLAKVTRALIHDFPKYYQKYYHQKEYTYNDIRQFNRNRLLWLDSRVDGVKTGHTESAGFCLITSGKEDDMRLISVVLGTHSDNQRVEANRALLNYGFRFYDTVKLFAVGDKVTSPRIWKGEQQTLPLGVERDLYVTVPRGKRDLLKATMSLDTTIVAPAKAGQEFGSVEVTLGGQKLTTRPLVALSDVPEGGLWTRMLDNVKLLFH